MMRQILIKLLKASPVFRLFLLPLAFLLFIGSIVVVTRLAQKNPEIELLEPAIGRPGEVILIHGNHFGNNRGDSWVEISGDRLSANTILEWEQNLIMVLLPETVQDGLVYVTTGAGKSNPLIFANKSNIPTRNITRSAISLPHITDFSTPRVETGKQLVIRGKNFGLSREDSRVLFTWQIDPALPLTPQDRIHQSTIACSEARFEYEFWSDQEIRVRIPDGAASGNVYIQTTRGLSNGEPVQIINQPGKKQYTEQRTYTVSLNVDITDISAEEGNVLLLRVPRPVSAAAQRNIEITRSEPVPYLEDYRGTILHQFENLRSGRTVSAAHTFLVTVYGIETDITATQVRPYTDTDSPVYLLYTASDPIIPSNNPDILTLAATIIGSEKNPYRRARLLYEWVIETIAWKEYDDPNRGVLDALKTKSGAAWDMALLFTTLARAAGIPALPVAGIIVDANRDSRVHWWAEFYLESFGWVPVDPAMGLGKPVSTPAENPREWYFGNIDPYRIAFSRGWIDQKPMTQKSRVVHRPRSYAFQPIWEESGGKLDRYTSFWGDPHITGVY